MPYVLVILFASLLSFLLSLGFSIGREKKKMTVVSTGTGYLLELEQDSSIPPPVQRDLVSQIPDSMPTPKSVQSSKAQSQEHYVNPKDFLVDVTPKSVQGVYKPNLESGYYASCRNGKAYVFAVNSNADIELGAVLYKDKHINCRNGVENADVKIGGILKDGVYEACTGGYKFSFISAGGVQKATQIVDTNCVPTNLQMAKKIPFSYEDSLKKQIH